MKWSIKRIFSIILSITLIMSMNGVSICAKASSPSLALAAREGTVSYQKADWNDSEGKVIYSDETVNNYISVADSTEAVTWNQDNGGWYVANGTITISEPITVDGEINLILADGCTLNAEKGIAVTEGNSLIIYAQSEGSGTLNAIGKADNSLSANASSANAGIGGTAEIPNSGTITIHGGIIKAIGGGGGKGFSGAGIGGGTPANGDGGNSGAINIYGGNITANGGEGNNSGAGIGGGGSGSKNNGGDGSNITIYGGNITAATNNDGSGGAGIGGGSGTENGGNGTNIKIYGGIVKATGSTRGAGIGGGGGGTNAQSGTGNNITITGGIVTAIGGKYAAGIGGGGGYIYVSPYNTTTAIIGGTGTNINISGGIVDATGGADNSNGDYNGDPIGNGGNASGTAGVTKTAGIIFEGGIGSVYGDVNFTETYAIPDDYTLTIPFGASLTGTGTLTGNAKCITENLSEDMINVPEDLIYTGQDLSDDIKGKVSLNEDVTICGQKFQVDKTTDWTPSVEKVSDLKYKVTYTHTDGQHTVYKEFDIAKAQTVLSNVETYKDDGTQADTFDAGTEITVKATPEILPNNAAMAAADFTEPASGQMAVYYEGIQVSEPSTVENGIHSMTVDTNALPIEAMNKQITLTVKYIESDTMLSAEASTEVTINAVAKVVKNTDETEAVIACFGESNFSEAFNASNFQIDSDIPKIILLKDVTLTDHVEVLGKFYMDLNGYTITSGGTAFSLTHDNDGLTVIDSSEEGTGTIQAAKNAIEATATNGQLSLEGGSFVSTDDGCGIYVTTQSCTLYIREEKVNVNKLSVDSSANIFLAAGTYTGNPAITISGTGKTLGSLLDSLGKYAYYDENGKLLTDIFDKTEINSMVTVKECTHNYQYTHTKGEATHTQFCPACGDTNNSVSCTYTWAEGETTGKCVCGATLSIALSGADGLIYDKTEKKPAVTVILDGTELAEENYSVSYTNNKNAGTASVTIRDKNSYNFKKTLNFSIAALEIAPSISGTTTKIFDNTTNAPDGLSIELSDKIESDDVSATANFIYNSKNVNEADTITANNITLTGEDADNYILSTDTVSIDGTITQASGTLIVAETSINKSFGDKEFSLHCTKNGDGAISYTSNNENVALVSEGGTVQIKGAGEATITVSLAEGINYTGADSQTVTVNVAKADAPDIAEETQQYINTKGSNGENIEIDVSEKLPVDHGATVYKCTLADENSVLSDVKVDENTGKLSYKVKNTGSVGDSASITVTAEMANYKDTTFTVNIKIVDKIQVKITAEAENSVYNGSTHKGYKDAITCDYPIDGYTFNYIGRDGTEYNSAEPPINAGNYTVTIQAADTSGNYYGSVSCDFVIEKVSITVKADDKTAKTGDPLPNLTYTAFGLVGKDSFSVEPKLSCNADMTTTGVYPITVSGAKVPNTNNYNEDIVYQAGTLTVQAGKVIVTEPVIEEDAPNTYTVSTADEIKQAVPLTEAEETAVKNGSEVKIYLKVEKKEVTQEEKQVIDSAKKDYEIGEYVDVSMYKQIDDNEASPVGKLNKKIVISLVIPKNLRNKNNSFTRAYVTIRHHSGENNAQILQGTYNEETFTFTFETDRFSTYAIAYKDTVKQTNTASPPVFTGGTGNTSGGSTGGGGYATDYTHTMSPSPSPSPLTTQTPIPTTKPTQTPTLTPTQAPVVSAVPTQKPVSDDATQAPTQTPSAPAAKTSGSGTLALNARLSVTQTKNKIKVLWGKVSGADGYDIYIQYCGKKFTASPSYSVKNRKVTKLDIKKINGKKVNLKKSYKLYITAYKLVSSKKTVLGKSIIVHNSGIKNKKYTNAKDIKLKETSYNIKKGKTVKINARTVLLDKKKKLLSDNHAKEFRYSTSNKSVATVSATGKIKAVGKGSCIIYVYAKNGNTKKIKVKVK